jgi:hypothetical protein
VIDTFGADAQRTRDLVWGIGWRGNVGFPGTAYCVGGKSIYWGGWCPRLRDADLQQWPEEVRVYLNGPPDFGSNLPNRLAPAGEQSVYQAAEFEIGVHPRRGDALGRGEGRMYRGDAAAVGALGRA